MRIHMPEIRRERDAVRLESLVERPGRTEYLWYSVPHSYEDYLTTERLDAFVVGLLMLGMMKGEDIYVDGPMSEKLFYNITSYYMRILEGAFPSLHRIQVIPERLDRAAPGERGGVATGFSGGVDSFCVLADHLWGSVPDGYRITHLLFNNVGSHAPGGRRLFEERFARLLPAAREMGIPFVKIDANLDQMLSGLPYLQSHSPRNVSAVLALQKLFSRYLYASGQKYEDCHGGRAGATGYSDPMSLPLLSTEATECIPTGSQYSRVEKTARISDIPLTYRYLDVCVSSKQAGNCSRCFKCSRTMLTLEMLGKLDRYGSAFDLGIWQKNRIRFIGHALFSRDIYLKEIVKNARARSWRFPVRAWPYAAVSPIVSIVRRTLRGLGERTTRGNQEAR